MSLVIISKLLINGILFGTIYGIAAIGLSIIFGTMRLVFLAQGTFIVFFAYLCYWMFTLLGIDPYLSIIIIVALGYLLGTGIYYALFKEAAANEDRNISLLIAVGMMFLMENLMQVLWTADPRTVVTSYTSSVLRLFEMNIPWTKIIGFLIALLATGAVLLFLKKTLLGTAVRAVSEDMVSATLMGINPHRVNATAFGIGIALAGIAGVVMATIYPFDPGYGFVFAIKALIALALGGIGNVYGAFLGGIILGVIETSGSFYVGGGWAEAISYGVFLLVLILKPEGLIGRSVKKA